MTVAAKAPYVSYTEDGTTLAFPVPWWFLTPADLVVQRTDANGVVTTLVLNTDYTASGGGAAAGDSGGTLTLTATVAGCTLAISRFTARVQPIDYATNDLFPSETAELGLDRDMLIEQEQDGSIGRAMLVPAPESGFTLPDADERAQAVLGFDANGNPVMLPYTQTGVAVVQSVERTASAGQTTFQTLVQYNPGALGVYVNGVRLSVQEFTATDGINVVLGQPCAQGDLVLLEGFSAIGASR